MQTKIFEIRDRCTFISAIAVLLHPTGLQHERQRYLLRHVGYPCKEREEAQVLLTSATGSGRANSDAYGWTDRTMTTAHQYIQANFERLMDGDVVDVQFILGETPAPKLSERERMEPPR